MRLGFAGTGVAAILTAHAIVRELGDGVEIWLVDRGFEDEDVRTYAYWARGEDVLTPLLRQSFDRLVIRGPNQERVDCPLEAWRYGVLRFEDLRTGILEPLLERDNVHWIEGEVTSIEDRADGAVLNLDDQRIAVDWAFDSRFDLTDLHPQPGRVHLVQSFAGIRVRTPVPTFPDEPVLMDFRVDQDHGVQFVYVLPQDAHRALVEAVHMAPGAQGADLDAYLREVWDLDDWTVEAREGGATPMTDASMPDQIGHRTLRLGILGGRLRPSTGYALPRILADADAIARSLATDAPIRRWRAPWYSGLLDGIFLHLLASEPHRAPQIFVQLFANNPADRVVDLLQERLQLRGLAGLLWSLPWPPFLRALAGLVRARIGL